MIEVPYSVLVAICFFSVFIFGFLSLHYNLEDKKDNRDKDFKLSEEKLKLGVDDKGFYIKRIGTHDFIVNYGHEDENPPEHDPGCPCGWNGIAVNKDTIFNKSHR